MRLLCKSYAVSLVSHTVVLIMLCALPRASVDRVSLSGRQSVISLEMRTARPATPAVFAPQTADDIPTTVNDEPRPEWAEPVTELVSSGGGDQHERRPSEHHAAPAPPPAELPDPQATADVRLRRVPPPLESPTVRDAAKRRPRRAVARPFAPAASNVAPAEQVAGVTDRQPVDLSENPPPRYPAEAVQRGWEGTVLLRLHIDAAGRVADVSVEKSSGYELLDRAAIEAVGRWQGRPARQGGRAVATQEVLPIRFRL